MPIYDEESIQQFDAFVLYDNNDIEFATELIGTMENQYEMKFCTRDRDLVGGCLEHEAIITIITERCNKLIVIASNEFFESPVHKFYFNIAQAFGIGKKKPNKDKITIISHNLDKAMRNIIPCTYKDCELPANMRYLCRLDYRNMGNGISGNFWNRLNTAINGPNLYR